MRVFVGHLKESAPIADSYLKRGRVIAAPTDTIYGLLGLYRKDVIQKLHALKKRQNPFLLLLSNIQAIENFATVEQEQWALLKKRMPGKNTIVFPKKKNIDYPAGDTIAIRVPAVQDSMFLNYLLKKNQCLLAPSLNEHGFPPLSKLAEIDKVFGKKIAATFFDHHSQKEHPSRIWQLEEKQLTSLR